MFKYRTRTSSMSRRLQTFVLLVVAGFVCALFKSTLEYLFVTEKTVYLQVNALPFHGKGKYIEDAQTDRLQRVRDWCSTHTNYTKGLWQAADFCIAQEERKIIYCPLTKVVCSSWKLAMILSTSEFKRQYPGVKASDVAMTDDSNVSAFLIDGVMTSNYPDSRKCSGDTIYFRYIGLPRVVQSTIVLRVHLAETMERFGLKSIKKYPLAERASRFKDYFKFIFVRDPFDRLLSAYREKLESKLNGTYDAFKMTNLVQIGRKIIEKCRPNASEAILQSGRTVTFSEFLRFINHEMEAGRGVNMHWNLYSNLINICAFEYDFIGKYETWTKDLNAIFPKVSPDQSDSVFPQRNVNPQKKSTRDYYNDVDPHLVKSIAGHFAADFELFGYDPQQYLYSSP